MRSFAIAGAVLMLFTTTATAGDLSVSGSTLDSMGLGTMQQLSDIDGLQVRGQGLGDMFLGPALGGLDGAINEALIGAGAGDLFPHGLNVGDMVLGELPDFDLPGFGGGLGGGGGFPGGGFPTGPAGGMGGFSGFGGMFGM
jgi:hypothetical protein